MKGLTSKRYPLEHTCACGVKTAMAPNGKIRAHRTKARERFKHLLYGDLGTTEQVVAVMNCMRGDSGSVVA